MDYDIWKITLAYIALQLYILSFVFKRPRNLYFYPKYFLFVNYSFRVRPYICLKGAKMFILSSELREK